MSFPSQTTPKSMSALPQTPLGELTSLPRPLAGFKGPLRGSRGMDGREGKGRGNGNEEGGTGRGLGGNSALVVGGIDHRCPWWH